MKSKLSKNTIILLVAIIANIAAVGGYYYVYGEINNINESVAQVMADIDVQTTKKADDRALKSILESTKEDREKIDTYLLSEDGLVQFIETIENLGGISGTEVTTSSVNVVEDKDSKNTEYLTMRISVIGSFANTMHFVSLVENVPHQVSINQIRSVVVSNEEKKGPINWNTEFELEVLKLKS